MMVGAGHHRREAGTANRFGYALIVRRHGDRTAIGFASPFGNVNNHRFAADIGERFARQPHGGHSGGNEDERAHRFGCRVRKECQKVSNGATLYVLHTESKRPSFRAKSRRRMTGATLHEPGLG